ncbi:YceI family protein [Streptomyces sp. NPDC096311]|uniref:YceI family protein n=1 Tax=Streptomyces sp. NPDC096311 TaxID=3366083 RepID=UPI00380371DC
MTSSAELQIPGYAAGTWTIDTVHSHVGFVIKHMMVSKVRGRFTSFSGEIRLADDPFASSVSVSIDATSIDTGNSMRDDHIRSADFFHAEEHPTLTFTSTGVRQEDGEFYVDGDLTIRGTTRSVTLTLEAPEFGPGLEGGKKAGFSATTEINRTDFGVSYNGPIPGGGVALADKVQIVLDVEADLSNKE